MLTIPWGEQPGCISEAFNTDDYGYIFPPGLWAVSADGVLAIAEGTSNGSRLVSLAADGTQLGSLQFYDSGVPFPAYLTFSTSGLLACGYGNKLFVLDSELTILQRPIIPLPDASVFRICPSDHSSWWVLFTCSRITGGEITTQDYLIDCREDGSLGEPILIYDSETGQGTPGIVYVTPSGELEPKVEDMYGYTYEWMLDDPGQGLVKYDPEGEEVFSHHLQSDPDWIRFDYTVMGMHYSVTWSGDFYTLHATDAGAVLTKYALVTNHDPLLRSRCHHHHARFGHWPGGGRVRCVRLVRSRSR
jgi:hypothetical protein